MALPEDVVHPSIWRRFAILNYDTLLLMAVSIAYGLLYLGIAKFVFQLEADRPSGWLFQIGWLLSIFSFFAFFWMRGGQTTGMRAWRVQIVDSDGNPPTLIQCVIRFITAFIGWLFFFTIWFNPNREMLHEKWSHTQLVILNKEKKSL